MRKDAFAIAMLIGYATLCAVTVAALAALGATVGFAVVILATLIGAGCAVCEAWWYVWNRWGPV